MEKRGLGKGLGALLADTIGEPETAGVREVSIESIHANPYQPRHLFDPVKLTELALSIKEHGILQPILLRPTGVDEYELVAGERRFRAAKKAGLQVVPAIIRELPDVQALEIALIENVQREDINALEAALAYRRLIDEFGMTQQDIARRVGKSQPAIANTLRLLNLPDEIQESLNRGDITEGHARALLQAKPDDQKPAWQKILCNGLNVRDTEKMVRDLAAGIRPSVAARPSNQDLEAVVRDPNIVAVEEALQTILGTRVNIKRGNGMGKIEIEFYSMEELEGIYERITGSHNGQ